MDGIIFIDISEDEMDRIIMVSESVDKAVREFELKQKLNTVNIKRQKYMDRLTGQQRLF